MVEHHARQKVLLPQEVRKTVHTLAHALPLRTGHGPADIQIEQHGESLHLERDDWLHLLVHEESGAGLVGNPDDLLPLLQTQIDRYPLENLTNLSRPNRIVLRIFPTSLGDKFELILRLSLDPDPNDDDLHGLGVQFLPDDDHNLQGRLEV
jgi:hypothetical protein